MAATEQVRSHPSGIVLTDAEFDLLRGLIYHETGISLKDSKRTLVVSRLGKCLQRTGVGSFKDYYHLIVSRDRGGEERRRMINAITTNKTSFFREPEHFEVLRNWIGRRAGQRPPARSLRIWSAACSTGEEPYTIAITAHEALGACIGEWDVRITASDIDTDVLDTASSALYPLSSVEEIPVPLRRKYLQRGTGEWEGWARIKPSVRQLVAFRRINLIEQCWPLEAGFDAIFCRNVIIYFDAGTQQQLFRRILPLLKPDGLLFVGHSETLQWLHERVQPVAHAVYRFR